MRAPVRGKGRLTVPLLPPREYTSRRHPLRRGRQRARPRREHGDCPVTATSTAGCAVAFGLAKRAYMHPAGRWLTVAAATVISVARTAAGWARRRPCRRLPDG